MTATITSAPLTYTTAAGTVVYRMVEGQLVSHIVAADEVRDFGTQHVYENGDVRAIVRPGDRESYIAGGFWFEIETLAGNPGQVFDNEADALAELEAFAARQS